MPLSVDAQPPTSASATWTSVLTVVVTGPTRVTGAAATGPTRATAAAAAAVRLRSLRAGTGAAAENEGRCDLTRGIKGVAVFLKVVSSTRMLPVFVIFPPGKIEGVLNPVLTFHYAASKK
eukprot:Hpha_TRINITY_DN13957_c1_g1::TRINITY_DN13957_c1_g1_i1::g.35353::m.35353